MKTKIILTSIILCSLTAIQSCKKDKDETPGPVSEEKAQQLSAITQGSTTINTQVQSFLSSSLSEAASSGYTVDNPPSVDTEGEQYSSKLKSLKSYTFGDWTGPDAQGWYTRSFSGIYDYYEKIRKRDTIDYICNIEYHGADGSYENETTTKYIKYNKNSKDLYKGFSRWDVSSSGYSNISHITWKIEFSDWNPATSAGTYDWYWGVSENNGGNTVPYHRYLHLVATETTTQGWLHCRVICYDEGNIETWDFEYDTPWVPVVMPAIPEVSE